MEQFLTTEDLAELLGIKAGTVRTWRQVGRGPPFLQLTNKLVRYERSAVERWLAKMRKEANR